MMIVNAINSGLNIEADDNLLDLGCGNAALASRLFPLINKYVGLDFSRYLLKVAKDNFPIENKTFNKINKSTSRTYQSALSAAQLHL